MVLEFSGLEAFYEELAETLDAVGDDHRELLLCKLSLLMARELGDLPKLRELMRDARNHLTER